MKLTFKTHYTIDDFIQMYELERKYYTEDHITPYEEAYRWHLKYPWSSCALEDQGRIIGFLDLFPINETLFQKIKSGTYNDCDLTFTDICDITKMTEGHVHLFLSCVVLEKEYRKTEALSMLFKHQIEFYDGYVKNAEMKELRIPDGTCQPKGIPLHISHVITDNVTKDGENFSKRLGFQKVIDTQFDSVIYVQEYKDFRHYFNKVN